MKFGHLLDIGEITPSIFSKFSKFQKAKIFLTLYNANVKNELKIPLKYAKFLKIEDIFRAYIDDLLKINSLKICKVKNFCLVSNALIHAYLQGDFSRLKFMAKEPVYHVAKLIKILYSSGKFELCFEANDMFAGFVYDKISKKHPDKQIYLKDGVIFAECSGKKIFGVMPSFKEISKDSFHTAKSEILRATRILNESDLEAMFIVFPRNGKFLKHVEVRHKACRCSGKLKLVPYTISHKLF
ncbi:hypothetical protein [Campylobacter californiensis]|uniref:hypothetical protein n=1 Tax=Campylobacter californiensis TaxID=1032243 RepID=UPI001473EF6B|nr:hypothetical protein [Campylobacter sp. RM12916]MBE3609534.1 hypothetical protein [Campylobacter sp. RM12916]